MASSVLQKRREGTESAAPCDWRLVAKGMDALVRKVNLSYVELDTNGIVLDWSRKMETLVGYAQAEAVGKNFVQTFVKLANQREAALLWDHSFEEEAILEMELSLMCKGSRTSTTTWTFCRSVSGGILGVTEVLQRQVQRARPVADEWSHVVDTCSIAIAGIDVQGRVTEWNGSAEALFDIPAQEALRKPMSNAFRCLDAKIAVDSLVTKTMLGEDTEEVHVTWPAATGERIDLLVTSTARRTSCGDIMGAILIVHNITSVFEVALRHERVADDLTRLVDKANAPIFGVDTEGVVTEWNQKVSEILGYNKDETCGKSLVHHFIHPENRQSVTIMLSSALAGEDISNYEMTLLSKFGERFTVLMNATTRCDSKGQVIGVIVVGQDITALNRAMAESKRVADDLTRLIETANAPIFGVDTQGRVTEWNQKLAELSEFSKEDTRGRPFVENFIADEYRGPLSFVLLKALHGEETTNFELPLEKDGERKAFLLLNAACRRGPGGEATGVICVAQDITLIREMTAEQQRIADDLSRFIDTANAPIFGVDKTGMVTDWNRKAADMLGYDKSEAIGKNLVQSFIQPDNRASVSKVLQNALLGVETANYDLSLLAKHGDRYTVLLNATTRRDSQGNITGVIGVGQDITELNQVMAESRRIADDLTRLIETANAPIFGIDTDGNVTEWNAKASSLLGFNKHETIGRSLIENFITTEFRKSVQEVFANALMGKETANFELPLFTAQGERREILLNATTRRGPDKEVIGVIGVGQDITQIREIASEQERIADDLSRLIDSANAPIFGVDTHGKVNEWNRKAAEMMAYRKDEAMGENLVQAFIQKENRSSVSLVLQNALAGVETANYALELISRNGLRYTVLLNATTRRDARGQITGVVGVGQDFTELNRVMAESKRIADDLTRLIETANAPIFAIDTEGKITEWNAKASSLLGYSKAEAMGKSLVQTFITAEFKDSVNLVLEAALVGKETAKFELPIYTKDGDRKEILLNATTRRGPEGEVTGVISVGQDITQIRQITSEHERVADDLSRLIQSAHAPIFGVDVNGMVTEWNRRAADMLGYTKAEVIGKHLVHNFIHQENRLSVTDVLQNALKGEETANYELKLISKHGLRYSVLLNATSRRDAKGAITGVVGVGQDITALNEVMEESRQMADDLTRLIETANAPIFGIDVEGKVSEWNRKTAEITGFSKAEAMGKHLVSNFIHLNFRGSVQDVLKKALEGEESSNYELPLFTKDDDQRDILLNATTRRSANGEVIGVVGVGQDITEFKKASERAKRIADDLTRLIETANAPIFGTDLEGRVTEWNAKSAEVIGFDKSETMGKSLVNTFIHLEYRTSVMEVLAKAMSGTEVTNFELTLFTKAGKRREVLLNATPRRGFDGSVVGVLGVGQDITELNEQRNEALRIADDLGRIIETANAPIFGVDVQGSVTEWNQRIAELSGFQKEEVLGQSVVRTCITESYRASVGHVLLKALNGEQTASFELPLVKNGEQKAIVLLNATTRRGMKKDVIGVICVGQDITQIQAMTEEQQRIAEDWARLIDNANAPIFGVDTEGMVTEWNRKAADISGFTKMEAIGRRFVEDFILAVDRPSVENVLRRALSGSETTNYTLPLMAKSGKRYTVLLNATSRRDARGQVTGVVGVGQDITELNEMMAESKRIAGDLTRLIETANAPIFGIDLDGNVTEWNAKACTLLGFHKEEAMGKSLVNCFITEEFKSSVNDVFAAALMGHETANFEFPIFTKYGERKEILLNATTRRGPDGEVIGVIGVGQDITSIREMSSEQKRVADDLSRLIENANAPIFGVDLEGKVIEWNRRAGDMLGYTKEETIGKNMVENFIQPENRHSVSEVLQRAITGQETASYTLPLVAKFGQRYTVLLNANARRDARGRISGVVGVGQDITKLNEVMAESKRIADDLTRLIETANAPIFGIDTCGNVTEWNAKASSLLGFTAKETMGRSLVKNFITEEFKDSVSRVLDEALQGVETANFEFPLFTKFGERKEILLNATTRRGPGGEITGVIGVGQDITRIREITSEQHRIADDLSRLIDTANAPIFGVDLKGMVTEWNRKAVDMLGYTKEETIGTHLVEKFILPQHKVSVNQILQQAMRGEETANYELPLLSKTGKHLTVLLNATTRRDAKGKVTGVVGVGQDFTELNQLMAESKRVADDLTRLIETANAPIFGINTDGAVTEWNRMVANITEYSKADALGKNLVDHFISAHYKEGVRKVLNDALNCRETANFEFPLYTKKLDRKVQILMSACPRLGPDGQVIGMIGVGQDITDLRAAKETADRTADQLARLIDSANAPIFGVDQHLCITEWNQMMGKLSGATQDKVLGTFLNDWLFDPTAKSAIENVVSAALCGKETTNFELSFNRRDPSGKVAGSVVLLLGTAARLDSTGNIVGVVAVGQDITEHKALEEKKMNFMAVVSHELRSPIHGIYGLSDALAESETDQHRTRKLRLIKNCSMRLLDLVTDIMDISSMRHKTLKLKMSKCNLTQIMEETVQMLEHATDKRGHKVKRDEVTLVNNIRNTPLPIIEADVHRCTQVFYNLVANALKFTLKGQVVITAKNEPERQMVTVSITDTGIGISPSHVERIFEPFEQESGSVSRSFEGIGLGLAITREVARTHGGEVAVTSTLGEGSTFSVSLPVKANIPEATQFEEKLPTVPLPRRPVVEHEKSLGPQPSPVPQGSPMKPAGREGGRPTVDSLPAVQEDVVAPTQAQQKSLNLLPVVAPPPAKPSAIRGNMAEVSSPLPAAPVTADSKCGGAMVAPLQVVDIDQPAMQQLVAELCSERDYYRNELRAHERASFVTRNEFAACKAKLRAMEQQAEYVWDQLLCEEADAIHDAHDVPKAQVPLPGRRSTSSVAMR